MGTPISGKPLADALDGTEIVPGRQGVNDVKITTQQIADLGAGGGVLEEWDGYVDATGVAIDASVAFLPWTLNVAQHHDDLLDLTDPLTPTFVHDGVHIVTVAIQIISWDGVASSSAKLTSVFDFTGDVLYYGGRDMVDPQDVGDQSTICSVTWSRYVEAGMPMVATCDTPSVDNMVVGLVAHVSRLSA